MTTVKQAPSSAPSVRPSACPGLLRIVPAKDGGICRIKLPCGRLQAGTAEALSIAAHGHSGGVLEATNRANLQIRGVTPGNEQALITELLAIGLGAATPGADDVRNLMVSPAAGLDPQALQDIRPLATRLLALLEDNPRFHVLSPKFALLLDGGEALAMLDHPNDIWLAAMEPGKDGLFAFGLAGCPPRETGDAPALAAVPGARVPALVEALLDLFLELATPQQARMRDLLGSLGAERLLAELRQRLPFPLHDAGNWRRPASDLRPVGVLPQLQAGLYLVGAIPPLGRLQASQLLTLAELAQRHGDGSLHMTPWQSVLLPNVPGQETAPLLAELAALGLCTDIDAPLARIQACTGSAGCAKGLADTKDDALTLAAVLPDGAQVHLCGCPRSCAAANVAPLTLLATGDGHYDLYRRDDGAGGFGRPLARDLDIHAAAAWLAATPDSWSSTE
ncbi:precorrin-3B synthase [Pseudomonas sp. TUM22785]|nr:precorrin-3B synthase [Pseudomonas sp. TUM22785]WCD81129.1 precorrin-3B synthase [Pseudomonas sp. TUM22785]